MASKVEKDGKMAKFTSLLDQTKVSTSSEKDPEANGIRVDIDSLQVRI
jgi:hypothetical protein